MAFETLSYGSFVGFHLYDPAVHAPFACSEFVAGEVPVANASGEFGRSTVLLGTNQIGILADANLIGLAANVLTVNGSVVVTTRLNVAVTTGYSANSIRNTYTSDGSSTVAIGLSVGIALTAVAGDTARHAILEVGSGIGGSIATQNNTETIGYVCAAYFTEPNITKGATDTITIGATVVIASAPTEGATNYALYIASGDVYVAGTVSASVDADSTHILGRAAIHSATSDYAMFSHYDVRADGTKYAIRSDNAGRVRVNSGATDLVLCVGNAICATLTAAVSEIEGDLRVKGGDIGIAADTTLIGLSAGYVTIRATLQCQSAGQILVGNSGSVRGTILLYNGAGGNEAGYVTLYSRNGTARFLFIEDDGTLKLHTSAPVNNADGTEVGAQT